MKCKICNSNSDKIFEAKILNKYNISYFHCKSCGFLQTEEPYWLKEAYKEPINIFDTGILSRNLSLSKIITLIFFFIFDNDKKFLDYSGGYGFFTRLMRDIGFDYYWYDPYTTNLTSRGFEFNDGIKDIEAISLFEVFEHLDNPVNELEKILNISKNIIFSTTLLSDVIPNPHDWWYYGLEHGQHISFYSYKTLEFLAGKFKLNLYSNMSDIHIFSKNKLDASFIDKILNKKKFTFIDYKNIFKPNRTKNLIKLFFQYKFFSIDLFEYVKNKLNSKTFSDMKLLIEKRKNEE